MPELEKRECSFIRESSKLREVKRDRWTLLFLTTTLTLFLFIFLLFFFKKALLPGLNLLIMPFLLFGGIFLKLLVIKGVYRSDSTLNRVTLLKGRLRVRYKNDVRYFYIEETLLTLPAEWGICELLCEFDGQNVEADITLKDGLALVERLETEKGRVVGL